MSWRAFSSKLKVSWHSHPLCPRQPKSVTSDLWRQVWPLHRRSFAKPELAPGGNCSGLDKLQLAWPEAALPCVRPPAFSTLWGTQLHRNPARRDIPRRPSNLTFVAVPKLKRSTSRRPYLIILIRHKMCETEVCFLHIQLIGTKV